MSEDRMHVGFDIPPPNLNPELSIVLPCFNEAAHLELLVRQWIDFLLEVVPNFELVAVNDGSTDGTGRILDNLRKEFRQIRIIHQLNIGHEKAVRRGYESSRGRFVLQLDANGRYEPSDFSPMWAKRYDYHLIQGARSHRLDSLINRGMTSVISQCLKILFGVSLKEPNISFRLTSQIALRSYLARLPRNLDSVNLTLSALIASNYPEQVSEVQIPYRFRPEGRSHSSGLSNVALHFRLLWELVRLRFSPLRRTVPFAKELVPDGE